MDPRDPTSQAMDSEMPATGEGPATVPPTGEAHLRIELARILDALAAVLQEQRQRGRTPAADAVRGLVIEEGEAEGLLGELMGSWGRSTLGSVGSPAQAAPARTSTALAAEAEAQGIYLPLVHVARSFELTPAEFDALLLALAAELDARFGRLYAYLNDHVGHTRPTLGLAAALAARNGEGQLTPLAFIERPLLRDGLLELLGDGPLPGRGLAVSPEIAHRLLSEQPRDPDALGVGFHPPEARLFERLVLEETVRQTLEVWVEETRNRPAHPLCCLLLAGAAGSGRSTVARAVTSAAGWPLVMVESRGKSLLEVIELARREARWYGAALLLEIQDEGLDMPALWRGLRGVKTPLLLTLPLALAEACHRGVPGEAALLRLEEPGASGRRRLWEALLPPEAILEPAELDALATIFHFHPGHIAEVVRSARAESRLRPRDERGLTAEDLRRAARSVGRGLMGEIAQRMPLPYEAEDLVVPPRIREELDLARAWLQQQYQVLDDWGFARRVPFGRGLKALFSGPSGTGKTMAAQVLTRRLGLELYRVDLSRVMSKYIGETEKNLARIFDEAHRSGAVLFFDEADALFGKRSEVKDAHDRYANVEVGYLLQRMEEHDGVVLLATNRRQDMDEAFVRRFDMMLDFPMPDSADRLRIWRGMLPPGAPREEGLDLKPLAQRFELSGGEIRNVVLAGAYLAAEEERPIGRAHLVRALRRELVKSGRVVDEGDFLEL